MSAKRRVEVLDMHTTEATLRAKSLGVRSVPAGAVDGRLVDCCKGRLDESLLQAAEIGKH